MTLALERASLLASQPREQVVLGELHLLRRRLEAVLEEVAYLASGVEEELAWQRVEQAARLARRALAAAVTAVPPLASSRPEGLLRVGGLRVDTIARRQWYGRKEIVLSPLHHRLLATMAAQPYRVFGHDELARAVWQDRAAAANAVKVSIGRVRRVLVAAGAPRGRFLVSSYGAGWALTRDR